MRMRSSGAAGPAGQRSWLRRLLLPATVWGWAWSAPAQLEASPQESGSTAPLKSARVTAISSDIAVDGRLDEPAWRTAPSIGALTQREPNTGGRPSERTDVALLRDPDFLYIGVMAYDSELDGVVGTNMSRDAELRSEDRIEILLDTYGDRRNAFYFATNPAGALVDGLVFANGQSDMNWDAVWHVRTRRTPEGWSAEFAIPFKSLSFPSGRSVWGFNVSRTIQRKVEEDRWSGARLETQFFQISEAGQITNLQDLTQGIGLDVRPFTAGRWRHVDQTGDNTVSGKPGVDLFYNFMPSLKLSGTVNTDFGETEVDARQINLSRYSLFFPEKRSFFLENAGVFNFSNTSVGEPFWQSPLRTEVIPFFSRTIGLLSGEEVPIDFGVKLTGTVGQTELGVLDVATRDVSDVSAKNFFVGRVKRNLLGQSYVGAILTHGNPGSAASGSTFGADVRLATSNFLGRSKNLVFNAYGLRSLNEGDPGRDLSYGASLEYPNDVVQLEFKWRDVQENFRPTLGFVSRRNVRVWRAGAMYNPRPESFLGLQQMFHAVFYNHVRRLDSGRTESWNLLFIFPLDWHFRSGDALHSLFSPDIQFERLFEPFEISPGVVLPVDEYRFTRWRISAATAGRRRVQARLVWRFGDFWSGSAEELETMLTFKMPPWFTTSLSANQTFARLTEGDFVVRILSSMIDFAASPFLTFSNLIQYDNRSRNLGWQGRVRWILEPGNDLFLVVNRGWIRSTDGRDRFVAQESRVSVKAQYTLRF